jgi:hypothetical protein
MRDGQPSCSCLPRRALGKRSCCVDCEHIMYCSQHGQRVQRHVTAIVVPAFEAATAEVSPTVVGALRRLGLQEACVGHITSDGPCVVVMLGRCGAVPH